MSFIRNLIDKFKWAFEGLFFGLRYDRSIKLQVLIATVVLIVSIFLRVETYDFVIIIIMCGIVIAVEMLNSSIERLSDYLCDCKYSMEIKRVKDLAAAAVLIVSMTASVVGVMILYKYIF